MWEKTSGNQSTPREPRGLMAATGSHLDEGKAQLFRWLFEAEHFVPSFVLCTLNHSLFRQNSENPQPASGTQRDDLFPDSTTTPKVKKLKLDRNVLYSEQQCCRPVQKPNLSTTITCGKALKVLFSCSLCKTSQSCYKRGERMSGRMQKADTGLCKTQMNRGLFNFNSVQFSCRVQ